MNSEPRNGPNGRSRPVYRMTNDRVIPKRVIRAVEEILLLTECWKRPSFQARRLH